jgi:hypothetical protein
MNIIDKLRSKFEENDDETLRQAHKIIIELALAVEKSQIALDDWLNLYASEFCSEIRVEAARRRTNEHGTIGYIADVQVGNRAALSLVNKDEAIREIIPE